MAGSICQAVSAGVVRSLLTEVAAVAAISVAVCAWNAAAGGYTDPASVPHPPPLHGVPEWMLLRLPALPFTLASPALGLLLVFRTNARCVV